MCGRFNLKPDGTVESMLTTLQVSGRPRFAEDIPPTAPISIIRQVAGRRELGTAVWWLLLERDTLKPSRYTSFNSRSDRLNDPKGSTYHLYRQSRCLVPATAFIEQCEIVEESPASAGEADLFGAPPVAAPPKPKTRYHAIELEGRAIAFGGLCKEYLHPATGEVVLTASIITLPGVAAWRAIHPDSMPLMIDYTDQTVVERWLDPGFQAVESFAPLLVPRITHRQRLTPIGKPSLWNTTGPSFYIEPA